MLYIIEAAISKLYDIMYNHVNKIYGISMLDSFLKNIIFNEIFR